MVGFCIEMHIFASVCSFIYFLKEVENSITPIFTRIGDVAQLARALDWQSRGRGFDSHLLHI